LDVEYQGANIYDVLEMTVNQAIEFFEKGSGSQEKKIVKRLKPLQDVGWAISSWDSLPPLYPVVRTNV